ncbi:amino acid adenylation domain-containing protein [Vallitalea guaymasensis]|uniref:amino acid adenylation domain-containing protein n=1 Tax=Vallitalea guaymasensis TaxID=1185412 RepID=UPI00272ADD11|nr:non-ribosomal peptide synthetase [Vallitalea guaymasensis]
MADTILDSSGQLNRLLEEFNETDVPYDRNQRINERFDEMVELYPNRCALRYKEREYTYRELKELAENIAYNLHIQGIEKGSVVGIYMERSDEYIISIVGILKHNCTFIPLSKLYPIARINTNLQVSDAKAVIVNENEDIDTNKINSNVFNYIDLSNGYNKQEKSNEKESNNENQLAYIIFTSGTTGNPKGIGIRHYSIINLINSMKDRLLPYDTERRIAVVAPFVFDASLGQVFLALLTGNALEVVPDEIKLSCRLLDKFFRENNIYCTDMTPTRLDLQVEYYNEMDENEYYPIPYILCAGEALPISLARRFYKHKKSYQSKIMNYYGPSETCVYSTVFEINNDNIYNMDKMLIGKPIYNTKLYIMDEQLNLCPIGVEGDLYIGGDGLSNGYIKQPKLTKQAFITNPYDESQLIYKTGDIARWTSDGYVEYIGRNDEQIKLRGYRIELSEIESKMEELERIIRAKTIVVSEGKKRFIVAYYTSNDDWTLERMEDSLREVLPYYMIPSYFVPVDGFKENVNGKLDRNILPDYKEYSLKPREKKLQANSFYEEFLDICKDVLEISELSLNDNFHRVGGDSLIVFQLNKYVYDKWGVVLDIYDIFRSDNIMEIAAGIEAKLDSTLVDEKVEKTDTDNLEVTKMQEILIDSEPEIKIRHEQQNIKTIPPYNMVYKIKSDKYINTESIENALNKVIHRHEMLRTTFSSQGNKYRMQLNDSTNIKYFRYIKVHKSIENIDITDYVNEFNIEKLPLLQLILVEDRDGQQIMIFNIHHLVFDMYSLRIFIKDLFAYYNNLELPAIKNNAYYYFDQMKNNKSKESVAFWKKYLAGRPSSQCIESDISHGPMEAQSNEIFLVRYFFIDNQRIKRLRDTCEQLGITEFNFFTSAFSILLSSYINKMDIIFGTYVMGRDDETYTESPVIGLFTKFVPVRYIIDEELRVEEFLVKYRKEFIDVFKHGNLCLDDLYGSMDFVDLIVGELFSIVFNFISDYSTKIKHDNRFITTVEIPNTPEVYPIYFTGVSSDENVRFEIKYMERLYSREFIDEIEKRYIRILEWMFNNMDKKISELFVSEGIYENINFKRKSKS